MLKTMNNKFLLRVTCATYNHRSYIKDALEGFVMQQTRFPYVCIIIDDASTDGEQEVIRNFVREYFDLQETSIAYEKDTDYGHVTFARHATNKYCFFAIVYLKENHFSQNKAKSPYLTEWLDAKYVAICEGDDYWTDPLKLQKQVDFLEDHPDFSMCFHGADVKNESSRSICAKCETLETREYYCKDVFPEWIVPTASIVCRNEAVANFSLKHSEWFYPRDIVLILKCIHRGRVWGMAEHMSVYRMNDGSVMARSKKADSLCEMGKMSRHYEALLLNFPQVDKEFCRRYIASYNYTQFRKEKNWIKRMMNLFKAIRFSPKYVIQKFERHKQHSFQ